MELNFKKEILRKGIHLFSLSFLAIYIIVSDIFNREIALFALTLLLVILIELEYFRIELGDKIGKRIPILNIIWKNLRREKEKDKFWGEIFFLLGCIIVLSVFDLRIAIAAMLMTTFGDMASALIGKRFGKSWLGFLPNRAWEGIFAEFFVNMIVGMIVFSWGNISLIFSWQIWIIVLVMALTATIVETLIYKLDDNLLIPVFAGFNGQVVMMILGGMG